MRVLWCVLVLAACGVEQRGDGDGADAGAVDAMPLTLAGYCDQRRAAECEHVRACPESDVEREMARRPLSDCVALLDTMRGPCSRFEDAPNGCPSPADYLTRYHQCSVSMRGAECGSTAPPMCGAVSCD